MPFGTQIIQLLSFNEQIDRHSQCLNAKPASYEMCFDVLMAGMFPWCFPFSCTKKSSTVRVTEYSARMQTWSVVAASV